jgi:hypothetical protein
VGGRTERRRKKHNNKERARMMTVEDILNKMFEANFTCYTFGDEWNFYRGSKQVQVLWNQPTAVMYRKKTVMELWIGERLEARFEAFAQSSNVGAEQFLHKVLNCV